MAQHRGTRTMTGRDTPGYFTRGPPPKPPTRTGSSGSCSSISTALALSYTGTATARWRAGGRGQQGEKDARLPLPSGKMRVRLEGGLDGGAKQVLGESTRPAGKKAWDWGEYASLWTFTSSQDVGQGGAMGMSVAPREEFLAAHMPSLARRRWLASQPLTSGFLDYARPLERNDLGMTRILGPSHLAMISKANA
ncbi:hypothetical protein DL764_005507 [Monosporascus ibericus]|uniref:Uncharacterized protein n=1 Tax=Monosporascus ibericus TaxID=155417 RepID=A0A4Q4TBW3_9PEZI|nr:hypothetical protein DL764_005507 [Monosporascus ibericus]